jgi:hypothetical protein
LSRNGTQERAARDKKESVFCIYEARLVYRPNEIKHGELLLAARLRSFGPNQTGPNKPSQASLFACFVNEPDQVEPSQAKLSSFCQIGFGGYNTKLPFVKITSGWRYEMKMFIFSGMFSFYMKIGLPIFVWLNYDKTTSIACVMNIRFTRLVLSIYLSLFLAYPRKTWQAVYHVSSYILCYC